VIHPRDLGSRNPRLQCDACGRWLRIHRADGGQRFYGSCSKNQADHSAAGSSQDVCDDCCRTKCVKPLNLEHSFRQAYREELRRAYIEALALQMFIRPPEAETIVIASLTAGDAKELARDLKAAVARLTKGRT
jgi:hypothetical protein